jgi:hypothetical protein
MSSFERAANRICTALLIFAVLYFVGHILAAWLRGSFEVVR